MTSERGDWCGRLAAALADGRFAENPGPWMDHLGTCGDCRERVEGLTALRGLIEEADRSSPARPPGPGRAHQAIERAFERYDQQRGRRRVGGGGLVVLAILIGVGLLALDARRGPDSHTDPVEYARSLYERVYPVGESPRYELLGTDEALRAEYLRALDHPESVVRRTALHALMMSNVAVAPAYLEDVLARADETLERPLEVAGTTNAAHWLNGALQRRRIATLQSTLSGIGVLAANGRATVDPAAVERFFTHPEAEVRANALGALVHQEGYVAGEDVIRVMREDEERNVRRAAATLLLRRGGVAGREAFQDHLRTNTAFDIEDLLGQSLGETPDAVAFYEERMANADVRVRTAVWHLFRLIRAGRVTVPPADLIERALKSDDHGVMHPLTQAVVKADWARYRTALQERWRSLPQGDGDRIRPYVGLGLMRWDVASEDPERAPLALEIAEADRHAGMRPLVKQLAASKELPVREHATALLAEWTSDD